MKRVSLSALGKTWILDLDGTVVKHNGYLIDGQDSFLDGAKAFLTAIPDGDMVIFVTSRTEREKGFTEAFLAGHGIRYDHIVYNAPYGERILMNDTKPTGLKTALAIPVTRDTFCDTEFVIDDTL